MLNKNNEILPFLALSLVALFYTVMSVAARFLNVGFADLTQVYIRIILGALVATIIFKKKIDFNKFTKISFSDWFWLFIMGVFGYGLSVYFVTLASLNTKLVNISVIASTLPVFVYPLAIILLKDKFDIKKLIFVLFSIYGVSVLSFKSLLPNFSAYEVGELYAVISVFFWGFWSIGRQKLSNFLNNSEISVLVMFIAGISTFVFSIFMGESLNMGAFSMPIVLLGLAIGVFLNIFATFLENYAFGKVKNLVLANQVLSLENIYALIIGYLFYSEFIGLYEFIGGVVVLTSVYLASRIK